MNIEQLTEFFRTAEYSGKNPAWTGEKDSPPYYDWGYGRFGKINISITNSKVTISVHSGGMGTVVKHVGETWTEAVGGILRKYESYKNNYQPFYCYKEGV